MIMFMYTACISVADIILSVFKVVFTSNYHFWHVNFCNRTSLPDLSLLVWLKKGTIEPVFESVLVCRDAGGMSYPEGG